MLGEKRRPSKFWKICWQYISPLILIVIMFLLFNHALKSGYMCLYLCLFVLTVYDRFLFVILSRSNSGRLYISIMGPCTWLDCCNSMSWLDSLYFSG